MSEFLAHRSARRSRVRRLGLGGIVVAAAIGLAGCGSSSSGGSSSGSTGASAAAGAVTIATTSGPLGTYLTDGSGRTLYVFAADTGSTSTCSGACAAVWPPVVGSGTPTASGDAKAGLLGSSKREDGSMQVTYAGHPLYTYAQDTAKGDTKGQGVNSDGGLWWVVAADGSSIKQSASAVPSGSGSMSKGHGRY